MQVTGEEVPYDSSWELHLKAYVVMHFLLVLRTYHDLFNDKMVRICHIKQTVFVNQKSSFLLLIFIPCVFEAVDWSHWLLVVATVAPHIQYDKWSRDPHLRANALCLFTSLLWLLQAQAVCT